MGASPSGEGKEAPPPPGRHLQGPGPSGPGPCACPCRVAWRRGAWQDGGDAGDDDGGDGEMSGGRKRVLVVGGGFGGMYTARHLERQLPAGTAEILLVNPENFMLYTPLLPEAAAGTIEPRHVVVPLRRVLRRTRLVIGQATAIDAERRTCTVRPPEGEERVLTWDRLVLTPGSVSRIPPIPGVAEHARGFKTLPEGIYLRNHVLRQLELADASDDAAERTMRCTFVVIG